MARVLDTITRSGDGTVAIHVSSLNDSIDRLNKRADDVQARLDLRRESLMKQFTAMESALSRIQAQANWLTSQINALHAASSNS
jgi:flagellar hook-associated protein 2